MIAIVSFLFIEKAHLVGGWEIRLAIVFLFATIFSYFQIRFYLKNIRVIEKGLEELKEFEEEPG